MCCEEKEYIQAQPKNQIFGSGFLSLGCLYAVYRDFCKVEAIQPKTKDGFSKRLKYIDSLAIEMDKTLDYINSFETNEKQRTVRGITFKGSETAKYVSETTKTSFLFLTQTTDKVEVKYKIRKDVSDVSEVLEVFDELIKTLMPCSKCKTVGCNLLNGKLLCKKCFDEAQQ